ncbi:MAG TPA: hypothetical protein VKA67_13450, partial [Verrucomicrobiae bacterium]|nr:hypothetical protein [Verrucomicrobiae bacterium]
REVNVAACLARGIPILRRCSGGGTVLQGPGSLNYTLVRKIEENGPFHNVSIANQYIMRKNRTALANLLPKSEAGNWKPEIAIRGHTDLAIGDRKFSGNSQRRHKRALLFHGTFLLNFDLALVSDLLLMPSKQPDYRESRSHSEFLMNLDLTADAVKRALQNAWKGTSLLENLPRDQIAVLAQGKYATAEWNRKF